jgi:hypothetical protein
VAPLHPSDGTGVRRRRARDFRSESQPSRAVQIEDRITKVDWFVSDEQATTIEPAWPNLGSRQSRSNPEMPVKSHFRQVRSFRRFRVHRTWRSQALESKVRFSFCRRTHYAPQFLRVCANCVIEDKRKNGGKTYWRRAHQLPLAASTMWLLHHITSSCLRHDASVGLFGLLNEASRQNWRTTLGTWRHLGKRGRRKWRTRQVSAVLLSSLDHGIE